MTTLHITQVVLSGQSAGTTPAGVALMNYIGPEDGYDGFPGQRGSDGAAGAAGAIGPAGPAIFITAQDGDDGQDGTPGQRGVDGAAGATGSQGPAGPAIFMTAQDGEDGQDGIPGRQGVDGSQGIQGPAGPAIFITAMDGDDGQDGFPGQRGADGSQGIQGAQGPAGPALFMTAQDGDDGQDGIPGQRGADGAAGAAGSQGPPGPALFMTALDGDDGQDGIGWQGRSFPGGADTEVQFNNNNFLDGDDRFIWNTATKRARIGDNAVTPEAQLHISDFTGAVGQIIEQSSNIPAKLHFRASNGFATFSGTTAAEILAKVFGDSDYLDATKILFNGSGTTGVALGEMIFYVGDGATLKQRLWMQTPPNDRGTQSNGGFQVYDGLYQPYDSLNSFTVPTGNSMVISKRVAVSSSRRLTLAGTARLRIT